MDCFPPWLYDFHTLLCSLIPYFKQPSLCIKNYVKLCKKIPFDTCKIKIRRYFTQTFVGLTRAWNPPPSLIDNSEKYKSTHAFPVQNSAFKYARFIGLNYIRAHTLLYTRSTSHVTYKINLRVYFSCSVLKNGPARLFEFHVGGDFTPWGRARALSDPFRLGFNFTPVMHASVYRSRGDWSIKSKENLLLGVYHYYVTRYTRYQMWYNGTCSEVDIWSRVDIFHLIFCVTRAYVFTG